MGKKNALLRIGKYGKTDLVVHIAFSGSASHVPTWYKQRNGPPGFFGQHVSFLPQCTHKGLVRRDEEPK